MKIICRSITTKSILFSAFLFFISVKVVAQCATPPYTSCSGLPSGATQITPGSSFGMNSGIYYYTGGATTLNLQYFNGGTLIICGGPVTMNGFNTGGDVIVTSGGTLVVTGQVNVQNGRRIYNMGRLTVNGGMHVNGDGVINSGIMSVTGEIRFNGGGRMCMTNGAALSAGNVYNDATNGITVPSGNACVSYSGSFGGNQPITNNSNLYICQQNGASSPSGSSAGSGNVIPNCSNCGAPLALDLLSFDVYQQESEIELKWVTANERNISHFTIEVAGEDGFFQHLKNITARGKGNVQTNYAVSDDEHRYGVNYYRLSEVDYSGLKTVLAVRTISVTNKNSFVVYPNPTGSGMSTKISYQPKNNNSVVEFYSPVGKLVTQIELNTNSTFYETNLPAGQYIVRLMENNQPIEIKSLVVL